MTDKNIEQLMAEARRSYFREWRSKNKDKVKQHNANFWKKKAQKMAETKSANEVVE